MKNNPILPAIIFTFLFAIGGGSFQSCTKIKQPNVDFTIDLSNPSYAILNTKGGNMYSQGVIIAVTSSGNYIAVSQLCTRDGTNVTFDATNNLFRCPGDNATYGADGAVKSISKKNLKSYNTTVGGNLLHVWG